MFDIYSKAGATRTLKSLEHGTDCYLRIFKGNYKPIYMRVVVKKDKYTISLSEGEYGPAIAFKENLNLNEVKEVLNEVVWR